MKQLIITLFTMLFVMTIQAQAANFNRHVVVVLDDSGTAQDSASKGTGDLPFFWEARWQYIQDLDENAGKKTYVTVVSVIRPQIVWQGPANQLMAKNNKILAAFLTRKNNMCPDFTKVASVLSRVFKVAPEPPTELVFISSLIHSSGVDDQNRSCAVDRSHLQPPERFFEDVRSLYFRQSPMQVTFFWVYNDVAGYVYDWFAERGIDVRVVEENAAYAEIVQ